MQLRLPLALHRKLDNIKRETGVSINHQVVMAVEKGLDETDLLQQILHGVIANEQAMLSVRALLKALTSMKDTSEKKAK